MNDYLSKRVFVSSPPLFNLSKILKKERYFKMSEERKVTRNINIEGARLIFKNFRGEASDYNDKGNRNFGVLLDDQLAEELEEEGWRVKYLRPLPDDPEEHRQAWLPVKVKFGQYPPIVQLINSNGKVKLDEHLIEQLDWTPASHVDLIIRPYNYPAVKGRPAGVSAYLKAMYYTKYEDDFEKKYASMKYDGFNAEDVYGCILDLLQRIEHKVDPEEQAIIKEIYSKIQP